MDISSYLQGLATGVVATGVLSLVLGLIIRKVLLGDAVINFVANHVDEIVDQVQKKDTVVGQALRDRLVSMAEKIIAELKAPNGVN